MIRAVQSAYLSLLAALAIGFAALLPIFAPWKLIFLIALSAYLCI